MTHELVKHFYRGIAFDSINKLIEARLALENPHAYARLRDDIFAPGIFFVPHLQGALDWAAKKSKEFHLQHSGVITVEITQSNFLHLQQFLWNVNLGTQRRLFRYEYTYNQPLMFDHLLGGQICVDIRSLSDEILFSLNTSVGLIQENGLITVSYQELRERFLRGGYEGDLPFSPTHRTKEG